MRSHVIRLCAITLTFTCLFGCGEDTGGVRFAKVTGVVTFKGAPISGAQVIATPAKGPLAMASTSDDGKFTLRTNSREGVAVGKIRLAVVVASESEESVVPTTSAASSTDPNAGLQGPMQSMMKFAEQQKKNQDSKKKKVDKSPLAQYANPATSNLSFDIKDGTNEPLKVELK